MDGGQLLKQSLMWIGVLAVVGLAINGLPGVTVPEVSDQLPVAGDTPTTNDSDERAEATAAAAGATPTATATPTSARSPAGDLNRSAIEDYIQTFVNEYRRANSRGELLWGDGLQHMARDHSRNMARHGYVGHEEPDGTTVGDRYQAQSLDCQYRGENVAQTYAFASVDVASNVTYADTEREVARQIVDMWTNSSAHNQNLLRSDYGREGIGVHLVDEGSHVAVYVTQNFC